jgi:Zn-dependent M16 (insulinase) family peptidase
MSRRLARLAVGAALAGAACSTQNVKGGACPHFEPSDRDVGREVADFISDAVYTGDGHAVMGTRWINKKNEMPVVVLRIQSVPQVFLAFNTPPVSDRGEPHTGEHLLLGKGSKGKMLSLEQDMSLVDSTAWTSQTDVCYSWSCAAGKETFFRSVEQYLDALLMPTYSDEEIRREVCHVGPVKDDATGKLSLDEKGTVYQEMVSTSAKRWNVYDEMQRRVWGPDHPLSYISGGTPAALRTITPQNVNEFHDAHYHLGADTQMIVALPDSIPETEFLTRLSAQMRAVDARPEMKNRPKSSPAIPPGKPEADKSAKIYPYPNANEDDGGMALVMWKPVPLGYTQTDRMMGELFLSTLANGESSTLYKRLMDSATRETPVDASEMGASLDASKIDLLPNMYFDGMPARNATPEALGKIVGVIRNEIARVAGLAPGSAELKAFNEKALVKLTEREKGLKRQLNAPPLFGHRNAGGFWLDHLRLLDQGGGAERSVALSPVFEKIRADLAKDANPWTDVVAKFGLGDAPFVGASVPSKAELAKREAEHAKRVEGYVADAVKKYGGDEQAALAKFVKEYDVKTAEIDAMEKSLPKPHLVADVPLTLDPSIKLEPVEAGGVKGFRGVFDNMTFVETSLSFRVDVVSEDALPWLAILPQFLTESGVEIDGKPVPYDQAAERRAKEIYALSASYAMRPSKGRHELRITASGADVAEGKRAIDWMELCLKHAWIAAENLPRLRDLVSQEIQATRGRLGGAEENWVDDPARAVRWQRDPVYLATSSIHARLFLLARCEWRLMDAPSGDDAAKVKAGFESIVGCATTDLKTTVANVDALVAKWKDSKDAASVKWLVPIAQRIKEMVGDSAPSTIATDLRMLADTCGKDVAKSPGDALRQMRKLVLAMTHKNHARVVLTGSRTGMDAMSVRLGQFIDAFPWGIVADSKGVHADSDLSEADYLQGALVDTRLRDHDPNAAKPVHYGLVNATGDTGVFINSAKAGGYDELDDATLTSELAGRVFGGQGPHGFFMKTWGAGLAYSNGTSMNPAESRVSYYAERCPDLVQTMSFVTGLVRDAKSLDDPYLAEYCVANAVSYSRESDEYESRAKAAADDMVDGDTPERVARYRKAVLALKDRPNLWASMKPHVVDMTGRVLTGVGPKNRDVADGAFFVIAPEPMLAKWEKYVKDAEGADAHVVRVYGRDFWIVPK